MDLGSIEEVARDVLSTQAPDVVAAWLFGSVARGTDRPTSDVDIALLTGRRAAPSRLSDLPLDLEDAIARRIARPVQIVVVDRAPADLVHRVLRDGRLLVDRDRSARIRFEVESRNRFFDMTPIWRAQRERTP